MEILGIIITYKPDFIRLTQNIDALTEQVKDILIIDNGSGEADAKELHDLVKKYPENNIIIRVSKKNNGIAWALRKGMEYAIQKNYDWVLSLDQDSVMRSGLVDEYVKTVHSVHENIGALTCVMEDRNYKDEKLLGSVENGLESIQEAFTSAFFTSVEAYKKTSGYEDKFFIDYVDYDICYQLIECGYKIYRIPFVGILHELGRSERKTFLWKHPIVTHHSAWRVYYMVRNMYWMHKKHPDYVSKWDADHLAISKTIKTILYEEDKINKLKNIHRGIRDGKKY